MRFKKLLPLFVIGAIAIAGFLGVAAYQPVAAQATTPTPAAPSTQTKPANPGTAQQDLGGKGGIRGGYSEQDLATALGIDLTTLQAAEKTAQADALKQAVTAGLAENDIYVVKTIAPTGTTAAASTTRSLLQTGGGATRTGGAGGFGPTGR